MPDICELLAKDFIWFAEGSSPAIERKRLQKIFSFSKNSISEKLGGQKSQAILPSVPFGITAIDSCLPTQGLPFAATHEWISVSTDRMLYPPTTILSILAINATAALMESSNDRKGQFDKYILWIGSECWPAPFLLHNLFSQLPSTTSLFKKCLFLNPPDRDTLLQATDQALRSAAVAAVIVDLPLIPFALSRRFELAAKNSGTFALFIRSGTRKNLSSASTSRWEVSPVPSRSSLPEWQICLRKLKGEQTTKDRWLIEFNDSSKKWVLQEANRTPDQSSQSTRIEQLRTA